MSPTKYFSAQDYMSLSKDNRMIVDDWLTTNELQELGVSMIQEDPAGEGLVLSGPRAEEDGSLSEYDVTILKVMDEDTFPWEVLKNLSSQVVETPED